MDNRRRLCPTEAVEFLAEMGLYYRAGTLEMWRHRGIGPRYFKVSRRVYYDEPGLLAFAEGRAVQTCDSIDVAALADRR